MGGVTLLSAMLTLVEHRLKLKDGGRSKSRPRRSRLERTLEPDAPEAAFLAFIRKCDIAELRALRREICVGALKGINAPFEIPGGPDG